MTAGAMTSTGARLRMLLRTLCDAALARPTTRTRLAVAIQLVLIPTWHVGLVLALPWAWYAGLQEAQTLPGGPVFYQGEIPTTGSADSMAFDEAVLLAALSVGAEGTFAFLLYWIIASRRRPSPRPFVRLWWQTCLLGTLALPLAAYLEGKLRAVDMSACGSLALLWLLAGPALLASDQNRRQRPAHWRPVCPECGYSLRRLESDRCPECGEPLPTTSRVYRRWAVRRLVWERRNRGSLLFAYIKTVLLIVFCPCRAAQGLAPPRRGTRAARWASAHLVLIALFGMACGSNLMFPRWLVDLLVPSTPWPGTVWERGPTHWRFLLWFAQSFSAWLVIAGSLPALGVVLGAAIPGRRPAARRAITRWSLYGTAVILLAILAHLGAQLALLSARRGFTFTSANSGITWPGFLPSPPPALLAIVYGLWWARGVSGVPYLSTRGGQVIAVHAALFVGTWLILTRLLFPATDLASLL